MKWSTEDRIRIVKEFKRTLRVPKIKGVVYQNLKQLVNRWNKLYDAYGEKGLEHSYHVYTKKAKLKAVKLILNGALYNQVAILYKMTSTSTLYRWVKDYLAFGEDGLISTPMNRVVKIVNSYKDFKGEVNYTRSPRHEIRLLFQKKLREHKEILYYEGVKAIFPIIEEMRKKYGINLILKTLAIPKSSYYFYKHHIDADVKKNKIEISLMKEIFKKSHRSYGYRRINIALRNDYGLIINHKKVNRLMHKYNLRAKYHRSPYNSYKGTVGKISPNILNRDFNANKPNEKWATDITEFHFPWGKVYLSPILDMYNAEIISYNVSSHPNYQQIKDMLSIAFKIKSNNENTILHSDQGWQYQLHKYHRTLKRHGITQSMSRKGNCLDNSKMENFFGLLKREIFYGHEYDYHSYQDFIKVLDNYIYWYNHERIKLSLGMSPIQYRLKYYNKSSAIN